MKTDDPKLRKKKKKKNAAMRWAVTVLFMSAAISMALSFGSSKALNGLDYVPAFLLLILFIFIGIIFDTVGVAVTSADETPFHSMSAKKVVGARQSVWLIHHAEKVSNVCNDVIGDICGIISGTTGAAIVISMAADMSLDDDVLQLIVTGLIAGLTIGGKAFGKTFAVSKSNNIVFLCGRIMAAVSGFFKHSGRRGNESSDASRGK